MRLIEKPPYMLALASELSPTELDCYANDDRYPKWNSLCVLRVLEMPVLDSAFVPPYSKASEIGAVIDSLLRRNGSTGIMVRSDGGRESGVYHRGGNSYQPSEAMEEAELLTRQGRAVVLFEPTDRFKNKFSMNMVCSRDGSCYAEVLGGGYDASDLNRGGVTPAAVVRLKLNTAGCFRVRHWDIELIESGPDDAGARRASRLRNIGEVILPHSGIYVSGDPSQFAENWLRANGYDKLWDASASLPSAIELKRRFEDGLLLYDWLTSHGRASTMALSGSRLGDGRFVYWDFVDANKKWVGPPR